jgi:SHS2 domain-containing protein
MYEFFEHTADLGLRAKAPDVNTLFAEMATALFATIVDDMATIQLHDALEVTIPGTVLDDLLFDWLRELVYRFDAEHWLAGHFEVRISDVGLHAYVRGEPLDPTRHVLAHEVKAITYHELRVEHTEEGWLGEVIVDI